MITARHTLLAVMIAGLAWWATAAIAPNGERRQVEAFRSADRVNVFELMSNAQSLPTEHYDSF